jgi:aryl sulfotransferase
MQSRSMRREARYLDDKGMRGEPYTIRQPARVVRDLLSDVYQILQIEPKVHYIYVGRDGRKVGLSFHNYLSHFTRETRAKINKIYSEKTGEKKELVIPASEREFFDLWLNNDGYNCGAFFDNIRTWWSIRCPNVRFLHYDPLAQDLKNQVPIIARFLGISPEALDLDLIIRNCSYNSMMRRAED